MKLAWSRRYRRRLRTLILGIVAFVALIWGAIDIVGVPAKNLLLLMGQAAIGLMALICAAGCAGWLLHRFKRVKK